MASKRKLKPAGFVVHECIVTEADGLYTIGRDHPVWEQNEGDHVLFPAPARSKFVRVQPPETASDQKIEQVRTALGSSGVETIIMQKRPRAQVVTNQQTIRRTHAGSREVVEALVREANTPNRGALETLVQSELAKVGL